MDKDVMKICFALALSQIKISKQKNGKLVITDFNSDADNVNESKSKQITWNMRKFNFMRKYKLNYK